jgi:hypothetical protein
MTKMIFINLPVTDLPRSMAFYEALGFTNNSQFTDETAACMVWSDTIMVMLLTYDRWRGFTARPIAAPAHSEVMLALSFDSKDEVNAFVDAGSAAGGSADLNPPQDHGFMFQRTLGDPDGHIWEPFWMDPQAAEHAA